MRVKVRKSVEQKSMDTSRPKRLDLSNDFCSILILLNVFIAPAVWYRRTNQKAFKARRYIYLGIKIEGDLGN